MQSSPIATQGLFSEVGNIGDRKGIENAKHEFELAEKLADQLVASSSRPLNTISNCSSVELYGKLINR